MDTVKDTASGFTHLMTVIFSDLESDVKKLAAIVEKEWPAVEDLLTSGQIGTDILWALNIIEPVFALVEFIFPKTTPLISWSESMIKQIAALKALNKPCACSTCNS